ncbi:MAG TPA: OmpH family outer membrane protein [Flavipsychrobacter sp.]
MKNTSAIFGTLALGTLTLFSCTQEKKETAKQPAETSSAAGTPSTGRIAYVNIDSLEANFEYLKNEKVKFEKRQAEMRAELERSAQQLQNDYAAAQRKAQAGTMTEAEQQSTGKRLMQMEQSLKTREEALTQQLMKEQVEFNSNLQKQIDSFLEDYNKDKKYDYILSYSKGGSIMFANKSLDITADVIKGLNERVPKKESTEAKK